ncbi:MAG TPA: IS21 family transposase [Chloroflexota bacterium]
MERSTIQLLHKRGKSQREIARELGYSRETVARALREPVDRQPARRRRRSLVDPYREQIAQWVKDGLSAVRMLELARGDPEHPYRGGHSVFRAAVRQARLAQQQAQAVADVPVRFEGLPAEYLQVDWGEIRDFPFTRQPPATRYFLACRLKYSRWTWVRFTSDMRQETLFRGLVDCCVALGWVPWVLTFDNMKTVTSGRDAAGQPVWTPALLQLAAEFGFHPEACTPGAGNQKGSVESLVKWVKGNFLAGREFADDADLAQQCRDWLVYANARPSQATDVPPVVRLAEEAAQGGPLPATARAGDYGFLQSARVSPEALVAVLGNQYSVPIVHVGAPVTVRVHRERIVIWRDTTQLAAHRRAEDGTHTRVVEPAHYALLFAKKPRAQVMLYREALLQLGPSAKWYLSEVSHRRRAHLRDEVVGIYTLYQQIGAERLLAAMDYATERSAYGVDYLRALVELASRATPATWPPVLSPPPAALWPAAPVAPAATTPGTPVSLAGVPAQHEVDRALDSYERYVRRDPDPDGDGATVAVPAGVAVVAVAAGTSASPAEAVR